jgi:hypothetical protein
VRTETEELVDQLAGLDWQPACQSEDCKSDHGPAEWVLRFNPPCGCRAVVLFCTPCTQILRDLMDADWYCADHAAAGQWPLKDILTIAPLAGS